MLDHAFDGLGKKSKVSYIDSDEERIEVENESDYQSAIKYAEKDMRIKFMVEKG